MHQIFHDTKAWWNFVLHLLCSKSIMAFHFPNIVLLYSKYYIALGILIWIKLRVSTWNFQGVFVVGGKLKNPEFLKVGNHATYHDEIPQWYFLRSKYFKALDI